MKLFWTIWIVFAQLIISFGLIFVSLAPQHFVEIWADINAEALKKVVSK